MLHRSRKTKSLRRNQRGAALRDGTEGSPCGRAGLATAACGQGRCPGSGEDGGVRGSLGSPTGAGRGRWVSEGCADAW